MDDQAGKVGPNLKPAPHGRLSPWMQGFSLFGVGLGIGWLTGLSVSPVVGTVVASLLAVAAGTVTGLQGVRRGKPEGDGPQDVWIDARPAALLVLGVAAASTLGVLARTHQLLEPARQDGDPNRVQQPQNVASSRWGVLFPSGAEECSELLSLARLRNPDALIDTLKYSKLPWAPELASKLSNDPNALRIVTEVLCRQYLETRERMGIRR